MNQEYSEDKQTKMVPATPVSNIHELKSVILNMARSFVEDPADKTIYKLTYDPVMYDLRMNDVEIYHAKTTNTDLLLRTIFKKDGVIKHASEFVDYDGQIKKIYTPSVKNNIQSLSKMPRSLRYLFKSTHKGNGMKITTAITQADIAARHINTDEIDTWLRAKP